MQKKELPLAVCSEAFPTDPDFPQLKIATDPALMLEVFREHLKPISRRALDILECIPFRFRCRQSTARCVLQYTLRVAEPGAQRQWDQWVTGLVYAQPGEAERLWQEAQGSDLRQEVPGYWLNFEPVCFIPDLQMLVTLFPYDRKLRNLSLVLGGALRDIEPQLLAQFGPGQWRADQHKIEPTRYRTEMGAALKCTLQARDALTGRSQTRRWYLKVYRNDHGQETFQLLRSFGVRRHTPKRWLSEAHPYSVVRAIAYLDELRTLVLEEAAGTALQQLLVQGRDPEAAVRVVARAVAAFNQDDLSITRPHPLAEQFDDVKRASTLVQWACPELRAEAKAITAAVVGGLKEVPPAPIHRDLKPDHIFLEGDRVIFIDLDSVALGDPVRDPAHLFAHITARVGVDSLPQEQAHITASAFVEEYFAHAPDAWRKQFPLHCAGALIEVAGGIFKRQEPHWAEKVAACVEEAKNALSGAVT